MTSTPSSDRQALHLLARPVATPALATFDGKPPMHASTGYRNAVLRKTLLAAALATCITGVVHAQATSGRISGQAPVTAGGTVLVEGSNGLVREVPVDEKGRYVVDALPLATYKVSLRANGATVDSRDNVTLKVGIATDVSFPGAAPDTSNAQNLAGVSVSATALPKIDVTSVSSSTIITSQDLAKLPLGRSAESVALLAPGTVPGSTYFKNALGGSVVSFAGSSVTENAYYVNGLNTTDPLSGFGGISLPYGAIDQQEILSGGYSAAYGRSDGGVISQVGKSGTNEWHAGAQVLWAPAFAQADARDIHYVHGGDEKGTIFQRNAQNKQWVTTVDGYAGGPLIKDKLFIFAAVEAQRTQGNTVGSLNTAFDTKYRYDDPKGYVKLNWNINQSNILELTGLSQQHRSTGSKYDYDYDTLSDGDYASNDKTLKTTARIWVAKYTSYITDDLTLTAMFGKSKLSYYNEPIDSGVVGPFIGGLDQQNPAITGDRIITNGQTLDTVDNPDHRSSNRNLRVDLNYKIGDHSITAGIDNQDSKDIQDGTTIGGVGYELYYARGDANKNISDNPFVDAPGNYPGGQTGYFAYTRNYNTLATVMVKQRAQYVEDNWQVNDRLLLSLGLRNDQFTNYNPFSVPYLRLTKPQWAPRLGFSWDVNGDSSLKVYGNAGRYFLAMPASVALRTASGSLAVNEYFTYTGIAADGTPTGITKVASATGGGVSPNGEYGQAPDPKTVSAKNIKSESQDEYILGFDKQLNDAFVWGMKGTVRHLNNALDDVCDNGAISRAAQAQGVDLANVTIGSCYLSNPGRANVYQLKNADGGYSNVTVTNKDFGFSHLKRNYYGLDTYLSHPFDGVWGAKIDYLYSRSYGNTEGQVRSDVGQNSVSASRDWDYETLMEYQNGYLANDRKHVIKIYGSYQVAPEWMVSANVTIASGTPRECLGFYGTEQNDPSGYGSYYHYCDGKPTRPGDKGRNPWQENIDLSAEYRPEWADKKLAFNATVFNVLNQQRANQIDPVYGTTTTVKDSYQRVISYQQPRYVRFGLTYDW